MSISTLLLLTASVGQVAGVEATADPPSKITAFVAEGRLALGATVGLDAVLGDLAAELNPGVQVHVLAGLDVWKKVVPVRGELRVGFSHVSRKGDATPSSLMRLPIAISAVPRLPEDVLGDDGWWPIPYLRVGVGISQAFAGDAHSADFLFEWGAGARLAAAKIGLPDWLGFRIDVTHSLQTETVNGHFLGVALGVETDIPFDKDGDGIVDPRDACPDRPEDPDGFEDADGCPDLDNDRDGLPDDDDACPDRAEDLDRFDDDDGCPDLDNDRDGIDDQHDECALEPEDRDGFQDEDGCPDLDNDGDKIADLRDNCPLEPEDVDGYKDADGCPDPDNDNDGIKDADDACPLQAEDFNGNKDEDGCPDAKDDRDGDGLVDLKDQCPAEPEDKDGFEDDDGCPDPDDDQDGVLDAVDACPMEPEDKDGYQDEDGCPELDNDGDGIGDEADECPNESEVINGVDDDDGCPDEGAQLVRLTAERIEISEKVYFKTNSDEIEERSYELLNQVAAVLENHKHIARTVIQGHTDDRGPDDYNLSLSQRRADSVRRYLTNKGIAKERLVAEGLGETRPVASNKSRAGREVNRRVEFLVTGPRAEPAPAP